MGTGSYIPSKYVGVLKYELDGITYYFIDNKEYFDCFSPYGNIRQDIEKFCFFDKAVLSMLPVTASSRILSIVMTGNRSHSGISEK